MKTLICDCNGSMAIDAPAIRQALTATKGASADGLETVHTLLCRREAAAFQRAAKSTGTSAEPLLVACTQERRLFLALNEATEGAADTATRPIRFVNLRETGGWSRDGAAAGPKMAALLAAAQRPEPEPVATVRYRSDGRCLVIGDAEAAERAATLLGDTLDVSVLVTAQGGALPQVRDHVAWHGRLLRVSGWLGAFDAEWETGNPIDLDACTRCNACVAACPEGAIGLDYQVDLDACRGHRDCVRACGAAAAIDFDRPHATHAGTFDVVLDLRDQPAFTMHAPPQGYVHAAPGDAGVLNAVQAVRGLVGEFDKPRFVALRADWCAHSRNEQIGCTACIDVCSTRAIRSDAPRRGRVGGQGTVAVEPHLCAGCGACTTVCPSGALAFAYPGTVDQGARIAAMLAAYAHAGGREPTLLIHGEGAGARVLDDLGRAARIDRAVHGVPARVLPMAVWHTASVGLDLWLAAIAHGARQVWVLATEDDAPEDRAALAGQMAVGQAVMTGLGFRGTHFALLEARDARDLAALDAALRAPPAQGVHVAAAFGARADKRGTLELAIEHLRANAPSAAEIDAIALPDAGAPFGTVDVDTTKCTLCLSCVGACPSKALLDHADAPQLRFIERNCVQCGLCAATCPEDAIVLRPRLWLADGGRARRDVRVLAEMPPFACIRCGKPFGTLRAVENVVAKLAGHAAFQGDAARRLKMCADCRVIDQFERRDEVRITEVKP